MAKAAVRAAVLAARRSLEPPLRQRYDAAIATAITQLVSGRAVAGYAPMAGEPGGPPLLAALTTATRLLLPVLLPDHSLDWAVHAGELVTRARALREPPGPTLGAAAITRADVIVVPAVAVDRRGCRLGRGGGSYDRALALLPALRADRPARVVAVLYPGELLDEVPAEPHDRPVDAVVTPDGLWYPTTAP